MAIKMLVVDDEPDLELLIRQKFRKQIRENEFEIIFAQNGTEALKKITEHPDTSLILTDINMPEMDGLTLLLKLNELNNPALKAIIVSAYGDMGNIRVAMNRGAFDFVTKPIDFNDLEVTINKTLKELLTLKQALKTHDDLIAIQRELNIATEIQTSILPRKFPPFPERSEFEIYAEMTPAREVGGDFYDFFLIDDERLGFVIGDVSGKGVPAAMFMAVSRTLLKATALKGMSPSECFEAMNKALYRESVKTMFVTIFYGILNTQNGELVYCNGGHNHPYLLTGNGDVAMLKTTGSNALGAIENAQFHSKQLFLKQGDGLLLYTDGVIEAMDGNANEFSNQRLEDFLHQVNGFSLTEIVQGVFREVKSFSTGTSQFDDITVLALRYLAK